jgi:predicted transcriptional regulator
MEKELEIWINKYPIPLFVSAFDNTGSLYNLGEVKQSNHLMGFYDQERKIRMYWRLLKDGEIPDIALNQEYIDDLYSNLVFKTTAELDIDRRKRRRQIKVGWFIFFIWLVIVPALIAILEFYSSWLSIVALIYSLYMALRKGLELTGKWKKSKREKAQEDEERLKNYYYYHCQMNPEGFKKLLHENLEKMSKDEITKEAESLKTSKKQSKLNPTH